MSTEFTLKPGDTIGVMAPCSYVERDDIEKSKAVLENRGYNVFIHPQTFEREHQSAGNLLQKSLAFQGLWMRDDIKAVWAAGGGNRGSMLLETINFERLKDTPKPLIGFSDVTPLLNAVYVHTGCPTLHAPVFKQLHQHKNLNHVLALLSGDGQNMPLDNATIIREGKGRGILVGGCLSAFLLLPYTKDCPDLDGAVLFLEDVGEELSRLDRMFIHLRRLGVLEKISGLVLGEFHNTKDEGRPFGYSLKEIIETHCDGYDIPIIMDAPFGHGDNLFPLAIGREVSLKTEETATLHYI